MSRNTVVQSGKWEGEIWQRQEGNCGRSQKGTVDVSWRKAEGKENSKRSLLADLPELESQGWRGAYPLTSAQQKSGLTDSEGYSTGEDDFLAEKLWGFQLEQCSYTPTGRTGVAILSEGQSRTNKESGGDRRCQHVVCVTSMDKMSME